MAYHLCMKIINFQPVCVDTVQQSHMVVIFY